MNLTPKRALTATVSAFGMTVWPKAADWGFFTFEAAAGIGSCRLAGSPLTAVHWRAAE